MLRSISTHNFIHFIDPQRLEFKDGTTYIIGGNSTGKSAIFELIRRSLSNGISTTSSSFTVDISMAYTVCHFQIPNKIKPHFSCNPTDIVSGLFVEKVDKSDQQKLYYYYKVLVIMKELKGFEILVTRLEGLYSCDADQLHSPIYLYYNNDKVSESIRDVIREGNHDTYHKSIQSLFDEIKQNAISDESNCNQGKVDKIFKSLEDGYVSVLPMRSIGPLQWTRSDKNCHTEREQNYTIACQRAEIINSLLDSDDTDTDLLLDYHELLVAPYRFKKEGRDVFMYNDDGATTIKKPLLKTPEGILEAEQLILLLSQRNLFTITLEEPDRGMHPQMITKMRDWVLKKVKNKTVLVISHNPTILDHAVLDRTYIFSKSIQKGNISHSVLKFPDGYRKYGRIEEMKNLLFCERILFVEGFTDKIFIEAIFNVLINEMIDEIIGKNMTTNNEKFRKYISTIHVAELVDGKGSGPTKMKFCDKLQRDCCIVYDFDAAKKSPKKGTDTKDTLRVQYNKFDEEFKDNSDFMSNSDAVQRFTSTCDEARTFIWIEGALEKVINKGCKRIVSRNQAKSRNTGFKKELQDLET
ncbi:unnamed protein product [Mytilus coruscus]|uniref:ATPase AAA-type core domain-containing protein n=1 Tax=Mytilus coruscus TaxID=42192 RepID=A0A6J8EHZ3_MYTCO|nr:unnamed protein product [Mytilus coruscus]